MALEVFDIVQTNPDNRPLGYGVIVGVVMSLKSCGVAYYDVLIGGKVTRVSAGRVYPTEYYEGMKVWRVEYQCLDCEIDWCGDLTDEPYGDQEDKCPHCNRWCCAWDWHLIG